MAEMNRNEAIFKAKIAEQANRYDDMVIFMKFVANQDKNLTSEERSYIFSAYRHAIGTRRTSWEIMSMFEIEQAEGDEEIAMAKKYREQVKQEISDLCNEAIQLLDEKLFPNAIRTESKAVCLTMKGDYYRYLSEVNTENTEYVVRSRAAYTEAWNKTESLKTIHLARLFLAYNLCVFYYEIMHDANKACEIATATCQEALREVKKIIVNVLDIDDSVLEFYESDDFYSQDGKSEDGGSEDGDSKNGESEDAKSKNGEPEDGKSKSKNGESKDDKSEDSDSKNGESEDRNSKKGERGNGNSKNGKSENDESQDDKSKNGEPKDGNSKNGKSKDDKSEDSDSKNGESEERNSKKGERGDGNSKNGKSKNGELEDDKSKKGEPKDGKTKNGKQEDGNSKNGEEGESENESEFSYQESVASFVHLVQLLKCWVASATDQDQVIKTKHFLATLERQPLMNELLKMEIK